MGTVYIKEFNVIKFLHSQGKISSKKFISALDTLVEETIRDCVLKADSEGRKKLIARDTYD